MNHIDLHTHSTISDGTDSPSELMHAAAAAGLNVIALTDHDSAAGWAEAAGAAASLGISLVPGMELTTTLGSEILHVLGYLFDPANRELLAGTERITADRLTRAERKVELINRDYPLSWHDLLGHTAPGTTVGKPHIADALVSNGYVPNRPAAFAEILHSHSPYHLPHYAPDPLTGVRLIRAAGGCPCSPIRLPPAGDRSSPRTTSQTLSERDSSASNSTTARTPSTARHGCDAKPVDTDSSSPTPATTTAPASPTNSARTRPPEPRSIGLSERQRAIPLSSERMIRPTTDRGESATERGVTSEVTLPLTKHGPAHAHRDLVDMACGHDKQHTERAGMSVF